MMRKLTKPEFCGLAERYEDIKRKRRAMLEYQARHDEYAVEQMRYKRVRRKRVV